MAEENSCFTRVATAAADSGAIGIPLKHPSQIIFRTLTYMFCILFFSVDILGFEICSHSFCVERKCIPIYFVNFPCRPNGCSDGRLLSNDFVFLCFHKSLMNPAHRLARFLPCYSPTLLCFLMSKVTSFLVNTVE